MALVLALALAWQLSPFSTPISSCGPLLYDEGVVLGEALQRATGSERQGMHVQSMSMSRPLHTLLVAGAFRAVGPRPWAGALVSAVSSLLALAACFVLAREAGGPSLAAWTALALAATNLFGHLAYTGLAESTPMLLLIAGTAALVRERDLAGGLLLGSCLAANPRFALALPAAGAIVLSARGLAWRGMAVAALAAAAALVLLCLAADPRRGLQSLLELGRHNTQYAFTGARPDDYLIMLIIFEGPIWCLLVLAGTGISLRTPGRLRVLAGVAPLLSLAILSLGYGHHALRYLSLAVPSLAIAGGVALHAVASRSHWLVAAVLVCALPFTRAATPRGLPTAYAETLDVLEKDGAKLVSASNFPVLQFLADCRGDKITFVPPVRDASAVPQALALGVTHVVLDFERFFLGRFAYGEMHGAGDPEGLRRIAPVLQRPNEPARGPYVWFEHGVMRQPEMAAGFDVVEVFGLQRGKTTRNSP